MAAWMLFWIGVSALLGMAALAAERALLMARLPTRFAWMAAIAASVAGPMVVASRPLLPPLYPDAPAPTAAAPEASPVGLAAPWDADADEVFVARAWPEPSLPDLVAETVWLVAWDVRLFLLLALAAAVTALLVRRWGWRRRVVDGVRVMVTNDTGPAVAGFLGPVVLLPRWVLGLDEARRRMILRHEREHIRGGDPPFVFLAVVALIFLPWSPALWWQVHRLRQAMELDCDARTLGHERDVAAYGNLLLDVGRFHRPCGLPLARFAESGSFLERRIRQMTARRPRDLGRRVAGWAMLVAAAASLAWTLPSPRTPRDARPPWNQGWPTYPASPFLRGFSPAETIRRAGCPPHRTKLEEVGQATGWDLFTTHGRPFNVRYLRTPRDFDRAAFIRRLHAQARREALASGLRIVADTVTDREFHIDYAADGIVGFLRMRDGWNEEGWYVVSGDLREAAGPSGSRPTL